MNKLTFISAAFLSAIALSSTTQAGVETYQGHGIVQSIDKVAQTITIKQDAVSELGWPVRVQSYSIDGKTIAEGVKTGEAIDFNFTADSLSPSIHYIHVTHL